MRTVSSGSGADHSQPRAAPASARSHASRDALMQAAMALWRTKGFAGTTVTDICKAAGVSKALFYVHFSRKEDVLHELEVFAVRDAHLAARAVVSRPYQLPELITTVIRALQARARHFPPELVFEAVMETYRMEARAMAGGSSEADVASLFREPFEQARRDGKLPGETDVARAAYVAQVLVADGMRRWAARGLTGQAPAEALAGEISAVVAGLAG